MTLLADSKPIAYLQSHASELLAQINATHKPIAITENGETKAVLQDLDSYENMHHAISLLKLIAQAEEDIRMGRTITQAELDADMIKLFENSGRESNLFGIWSDREDIGV